MAKMYPDISHYDTVTDWKMVKENCPFIIHKATQRWEKNRPVVDEKLKSFITNCEKYKIPYWLYAYLEKGNEDKQTEFLVKTCRNLVGPYFIGYCLDAEEENKPDDILSALKILKATGEKSMLYTMYSQYSIVHKAANNRGKDVAWWEARYGLNNGKYSPLFKPHKHCDLHQYTDKGKLNYISGKLDLNRLTGTLKVDWFTTKNGEKGKNRVYYIGTYPKLPPRGYFMLYDGMKSYVSYKPDIKKVQKLVNWITGSTLEVDGEYGKKTKKAVMTMQKILGVRPDGEFGTYTLNAAKEFYK